MWLRLLTSMLFSFFQTAAGLRCQCTASTNPETIPTSSPARREAPAYVPNIRQGIGVRARSPNSGQPTMGSRVRWEHQPGFMSLEGFTVKGDPFPNSNGDDRSRGFIFYGIKYGVAKRFQDAEVNYDHSYLANISRNRYGAMCMQTPFSPLSGTPSVGNTEFGEDCLYLDIYVPQTRVHHQKLLPVLLWAWAGFLMAEGKTQAMGADFSRATRSVVVIAQVRVGPFGFLSTGDETCGGNFALSDLKTAFNWVYDTIGKFGGDNTKIVVAGQNDGAALTSAMLLDSEIASRVYGALTLSGSVLSPWALDTTPMDKAIVLAALTDCPTSTVPEMIACLRNVSAADLQKASISLQSNWGSAPGEPVWSMIIDGKHILYDPDWILRDRNRKHSLRGGFVHSYIQHDPFVSGMLGTLGVDLSAPVNRTLSLLKTFGIPRIIRQATLCRNFTAAAIELVSQTYGIGAAGTDVEILRKNLYELIEDINYRLPAIKEAMLYSETNATQLGNQLSVIGYEADIGTNAASNTDKGAYHMFQVRHLFTGPLLLGGKSETDVTLRELRRQFQSILTRGYGLGEQFDVSLQNYILLGHDKRWSKQKFASAVRLIQFWDKLKELGCAIPPPDAGGP